MTDPNYKKHSISSPFGGVRTVGWEKKVQSLLDPGQITDYRYTNWSTGLANARSDIDYAVQSLESQLAHVREADSILREIETYEAAQNEDNN